MSTKFLGGLGVFLLLVPSHVFNSSSLSVGRRSKWRALLLAAVAATASAQTADDFNPGANYDVYAFALQPDGKILVGGYFGILAGQSHNHLGRLNADGTLDTPFNFQPYYEVMALAVQPDGKILVGTAGGPNGIGFWRLNANGTLGSTFNVFANGTYLSCLVVQEDGKILVGGNCTIQGAPLARYGIGRLNANGTVDTAFNAGTTIYTTVFSIAVQPDGKILMGGVFGTVGGQSRRNIARLEANGAVDMTFNPGTDNQATVYALAVQPDGKILVGGTFTTLGGQPRNNIGRLDANGIVDDAFIPGANMPGATTEINSLALQADGKLVVGGRFLTLAGQPRSHLGRFNPDGTFDPSFDVPVSGNYSNGRVISLAIQADGRILTGGYFTNLAGQSRTNIGRLDNTDMPFENLTASGSTISWMRGGTSPEISRTTFETSTNGTNWLNLGAGTRIPGGWELSGVTLTTNETIRARGDVAGGNNNGSCWFVERAVTLGPLTPPKILANDAGFGVVSNTFGFTVVGLPGQTAIVEASTNLLDWVSVWTNALGSEPSYFNDSSCPDSPRRFYRARLP